MRSPFGDGSTLAHRHDPGPIRLATLTGLSALGAVLIATTAMAAVLSYSSVLSGDQAGVASSGLGAGTFTIDTDANTVAYTIVFSGMTSAETVAHIHGVADPGVGAGVLHGLPLGSPKTGVWSYDESLEADIVAGRTYVNIHSVNFGGGELRGQVVSMNTLIGGAQESPATGSSGTGWGTFVIDTSLNQLRYHIEFSGVPETAAHIHGMAMPGTGSGVVHPLPLGSPKVGVWNYDEAQEAAIIAGQTYVNIHSAAFPGGEIRGQVVSVVSPIDPAQVSPPTASTGAGFGLFSIDLDNDVLGYDIRFTGLTSAESVSHIHGYAPRGTGAGVVHGLSLGSPKQGTWNYGVADEQNLLDGLAYVNIHSANFGGGEIRGQIEGLPAPQATAAPLPLTAGSFELTEAWPNPFAGTTDVRLRVARSSTLTLAVFDVRGRRVRTLMNGRLSAGDHPFTWDGRDEAGQPAANGVYHVVVEAPGERATRSVAILR